MRGGGITQPLNLFVDHAWLVEQERSLDHVQHAREFFGEAVAPGPVVRGRVERGRDQSLAPVGETALFRDRRGLYREMTRRRALPGSDAVDCVAGNTRERIHAEPKRALVGRQCAATADYWYADPVRSGDGACRPDKRARHRTAQSERDRSAQLEIVHEIIGGHGRAEEQDPAPLQCERGRDNTSSQRVRVACGASHDDCWTTRLLGNHAESHDQLIDGFARGMFRGDTDISRRPTETELGLNRTKHVDRDFVEGHALSQELGCQPIRERDIAINEGGQHRQTLISKSASAELRTQLVYLLARSSSNLYGGDDVASRNPCRHRGAYGAGQGDG